VPDDKQKPPLSYELPPSSPVSRRQFRLLMALVLVNLLITLQFAYFPNLTASIKNRWTQYQQKREREAAVKQALAVEQQAMSFADPPDKVVWDENPETAAKLLAAGGYKSIPVENLNSMPSLANWPRGAAAVAPPVARAVLDARYLPGLRADGTVDESAMVLMRGLQSPSGQRRLVYVFVQGKLLLINSGAHRLERPPPGAAAPDRRPGTFSVTKELRVVAVPCMPGAGEKPASHTSESTTLMIHGTSTDGLPLKWHWAPPSGDKPEEIRIEGREMFRFYAGQPDPSDPSRFTIDYDVDGQRGTIRGQLKNDGTVELKPTTGMTIGRRWYPNGSTTQPVGQ
jgi:hypothetical protein